MLETHQLQCALDDAIERFVDQIAALASTVSDSEAPDVSALGKEVLRILAECPDGRTASALADDTGVGFGEMFEELRDLMARNQLLRIVRGEQELPVYMLPSSRLRRVR